MESNTKMNTASVMEFLGGVALLQMLPISSLRKIAQLLIVKHFDRGDYILREGDTEDGIYIIFTGEVEISGSMYAGDEVHYEFQLKQFDYFGLSLASSLQQADVIALTNLTCLVLPHECRHLLEPKSIWSSEKTLSVNKILHLDPIEVNLFRGISLLDAPKTGKVFGGQLIGQALAAASKSVDCLKIVHSLHVYFLHAGDLDIPIIYQAHRLKDGDSFATRRVEARQKGNVLCILFASFQKEEEGFDHQEAKMPSVPDPGTLLSMEELRERRIPDPRLPRTYSNRVATINFVPWPIEIKFCEPHTSGYLMKSPPPSIKYWLRAKGRLSDDQALHRCVAAYASDLIFLGVSLYPYDIKVLTTSGVSLDHSMWFHRPFRVDEWLLFVINSPVAYNGRGVVSGLMFTRNGELVVSITQEGLLRKVRPPKYAAVSKI